MAKQQTSESLAQRFFDYSLLDTNVANKVRNAAGRIQRDLKNSLWVSIEIGNDLLAVKTMLPHGKFGLWLNAEFDWSERTAQNFMNVANAFKNEKFADLKIQPSAAYILASPTVPDEARLIAIKRAESGEEVTSAMAKEIIAEVKKKSKKQTKPVSSAWLVARLEKDLKRCRDQWNAKQISELARRLEQIASDLQKEGGDAQLEVEKRSDAVTWAAKEFQGSDSN